MTRLIVATSVFFITISALLLYNKNPQSSQHAEVSNTPEIYLAQIRLPTQKTSTTQTPIAPTATPTTTPTNLIPSMLIPATTTITPTPTSIVAQATITPNLTPTTTLTLSPTQSGGLVVASLTSPVAQKQTATIKVQTDPNAACTIEVTLPSGSISTSKDLTPKTADTSGLVMWSWGINWNTKTGTAIIKLSCIADGKSYSGQTTMQIVAST